MRDERYIVFQSGGATWAISAGRVIEVLPTTLLERPPGSPRALAGFMVLAGQPLAVVRLAALFGAAEVEGDDFYRHVLRLARGSGAPLGLLVDRVTDVDARADAVAPLEAEQSVNGALVANLVVGGALVPLIDCDRLLLMEEQQRIDELAAAARARRAEVEHGPA